MTHMLEIRQPLVGNIDHLACHFLNPPLLQTIKGLVKCISLNTSGSDFSEQWLKQKLDALV